MRRIMRIAQCHWVDLFVSRSQCTLFQHRSNRKRCTMRRLRCPVVAIHNLIRQRSLHENIHKYNTKESSKWLPLILLVSKFFQTTAEVLLHKVYYCVFFRIKKWGREVDIMIISTSAEPLFRPLMPLLCLLMTVITKAHARIIKPFLFLLSPSERKRESS